MQKNAPALAPSENERGYLPDDREGWEELAPPLWNLAAAGCYKLGCSVDELRKAVDAAGFALLDVDMKGVKGKKNLLNVLAHATGFSDEFGANWDALVDVFCDLSWRSAPGYVLLLKNASSTLGLSSNDREIAQDIFDDTVIYWRQRNKPFWIFFA